MRIERKGLGRFVLLAAAVQPAWPVAARGQAGAGAGGILEVPGGPEPEKAEFGGEEAASPLPDAERGEFTFLDEPGDGAIWARGPSYKASFSAAGFTYIPFLGSEAPRNFPIRFTLSFVGVGEANLLAGSGAVPRRVGENRVVYDHGALQEIYEIRLEGVEQLFVLSSSPGEGDLVVRIQVESELEFVGVEGGKQVFEAPGLGAVRYGEALAVDAGGVARAATVAYDGGLLELRVPSSAAAGASYPLTIDPVISTFSIAPGNFIQFHPDVSFDKGTNLVSARYTYTWEHAFSASDHDIWSRVRTVWGTLGAYVAQDITSVYWTNPANAGNDQVHRVLVVADVDWAIGPVPQHDVRGRMFDPLSSTNASPQFDIQVDLLNDDVDPDVGGAPSNGAGTAFCVVWQRNYALLPENDVLARTVHPTTLALGPVFAVDDTTLTIDKNPAISKGNDSSGYWYVAFERQVLLSGHDIRGHRVYFSGGTVGGSFAVESSGTENRNPDVAVSNGAAVFVWERDAGANHDILGRTFVNASPVAPTVNLSSSEPGTPVSQDQRHPTVGADDCRFVYAYAESYNGSATDYDIRLAAVRPTLSGFLWDQGHVFVPNAFTSALEDHPKIASRWTGGGSGPEHAVAFDDNNVPGTGWYEIHAVLYAAHSGALTTASVPTSCGAPPPTIAATGTSALNGTLSVQSTAGQGGSLLLLIGPPGATPLCAGTGSCTIGTSLFPPIVLLGGSVTGTVPCIPALAGGVVAFQAAEHGAGLAGGCDISGVGVLLSDTINVTFGY